MDVEQQAAGGQNYLMVVSDGVFSDSANLSNFAARLASAGVRVLGVSMAEDKSTPEFKEFATKTGGVGSFLPLAMRHAFLASSLLGQAHELEAKGGPVNAEGLVSPCWWCAGANRPQAFVDQKRRQSIIGIAERCAHFGRAGS